MRMRFIDSRMSKKNCSGNSSVSSCIRRNSRVCFNAVLMRSALSEKPIASTLSLPNWLRQ